MLKRIAQRWGPSHTPIVWVIVAFWWRYTSILLICNFIWYEAIKQTRVNVFAIPLTKHHFVVDCKPDDCSKGDCIIFEVDTHIKNAFLANETQYLFFELCISTCCPLIRYRTYSNLPLSILPVQLSTSMVVTSNYTYGWYPHKGQRWQLH